MLFFSSSLGKNGDISSRDGDTIVPSDNFLALNFGEKTWRSSTITSQMEKESNSKIFRITLSRLPVSLIRKNGILNAFAIFEKSGNNTPLLGPAPTSTPLKKFLCVCDIDAYPLLLIINIFIGSSSVVIV